MNPATTEAGMARSSGDERMAKALVRQESDAVKCEHVAAPGIGEATELTEVYEEFVRWMSSERDRDRREEWKRLEERLQRNQRIRRRLAACVAVFSLMVVSFGAGQQLPLATCQQAFANISHKKLLHLGTNRPVPRDHLASTNISARTSEPDESPARLQRLEPKSCDQCGKRLWPLMSPGEPCPHCQARDAENGKLVLAAGADGN